MTNIGIIGIGCIGSSLARDVKTLNLGEVYLCDRNTDYLSRAQELDLGHNYFRNVKDLAQESDIIIVSVPVIYIADVILEASKYAKEGAIITDVGSVKCSIIERVEDQLPRHVTYIPGHPITAYTVGNGPDAGRDRAFDGKVYALTPLEDTPLEALEVLSNILQQIGANIAIMEPERHDICLGFTSHLPHLIAFSMMNSSAKLTSQLHEDVTKYAGGSFQDLTRVAGSDAQMWQGIFSENKDNLIELCDLFMSELSTLREMVKTEDQKGLEEFIKQARNVRLKAFNN